MYIMINMILKKKLGMIVVIISVKLLSCGEIQINTKIAILFHIQLGKNSIRGMSHE
jgi:hypothetical protein